MQKTLKANDFKAFSGTFSMAEVEVKGL